MQQTGSLTAEKLNWHPDFLLAMQVGFADNGKKAPISLKGKWKKVSREWTGKIQLLGGRTHLPSPYGRKSGWCHPLMEERMIGASSCKVIACDLPPGQPVAHQDFPQQLLWPICLGHEVQYWIK